MTNKINAGKNRIRAGLDLIQQQCKFSWTYSVFVDTEKGFKLAATCENVNVIAVPVVNKH